MQYWVLDNIFEPYDAHRFLIDAVNSGAIDDNDSDAIRVAGHEYWYCDDWRQEFRRRANNWDIPVSWDSQTFVNAIANKSVIR